MIPRFAELALFWFVLLGSKLLLGGVVLYMLLPRDRTCAVCDAELIPLTAPLGVARVMKVFRLQRLWCVECDRQSLGRRRGGSGLVTGQAVRPVAEVRVR